MGAGGGAGGGAAIETGRRLDQPVTTDSTNKALNTTARILEPLCMMQCASARTAWMAE